MMNLSSCSTMVSMYNDCSYLTASTSYRVPLLCFRLFLPPFVCFLFFPTRLHDEVGGSLTPVRCKKNSKDRTHKLSKSPYHYYNDACRPSCTTSKQHEAR